MRKKKAEWSMIGKGACLLACLNDFCLYTHRKGESTLNDIYLNVHFFPSFAFAYHSLRRFVCVCVARRLAGVVDVVAVVFLFVVI